MEIISLIILGLSLSIDAFSLSLTYGLLNIPKKTILTMSFSVGVFHFVMPILGIKLGNIITDTLNINSKTILIIILVLILIEMIKSIKEETKEHNLSLINVILFSLLVSFDSFTLGIGLNYITNRFLLAPLIFSIISSMFTFLGFTLGKYISTRVSYRIKLIGIVLFITILMYFLCK